jgi:hypothetical protein
VVFLNGVLVWDPKVDLETVSVETLEFMKQYDVLPAGLMTSRTLTWRILPLVMATVELLEDHPLTNTSNLKSPWRR